MHFNAVSLFLEQHLSRGRDKYAFRSVSAEHGECSRVLDVFVGNCGVIKTNNWFFSFRQTRQTHANADNIADSSNIPSKHGCRISAQYRNIRHNSAENELSLEDGAGF